MKALTVWQPWASLIACGAKKFETRSWATRWEGFLAIHAAARKDVDSLALCHEAPFRQALVDAGFGTIGELPFGAVVGIVELIACRPVEERREIVTANERAFGDWRDGRFAWQLRLVRTFDEPVPARGHQGLWDWGG